MPRALFLALLQPLHQRLPWAEAAFPEGVWPACLQEILSVGDSVWEIMHSLWWSRLHGALAILTAAMAGGEQEVKEESWRREQTM